MEEDGEPVCILLNELQNDGSIKFSLDEDALRNILFQNNVINKKVAVVSVVGPYRKGKSFLLSFMQRYLRYEGKRNWMKGDNQEDLVRLTGFHWERGLDRITEGIWLWSKPYIVKVEGEEVAVLLMDTQGTFDIDSDESESTFVLAFSTMISSIQIFNLDQHLQSPDLDHLHYCTSFGKLAMEENMHKPFQRLEFLIRNWAYPDKHSLGGVGGNDYLNSILNKVRAKPQCQTKEVCDHIEQCFDQVGCFLLPSPGEHANSNPDFEGALSQIEENFKDGVKELCTQLLSPQHLAVKKINSQSITCSTLFSFCQTWGSKLNSGDMPTPSSIHSLASENICVNAYSHAVNEYYTAMQNQCRDTIYSDRELQNHHGVFLTSALLTYDGVPKLGGERSNQCMRYKEKVSIDINKLYTGIKQCNQAGRSSRNWKRATIGLGVLAVCGFGGAKYLK